MRNKDKAIIADPFLSKCHGKTGLPSDAVFGCAYGLNMGVDIFVEAAFFRRTGTGDELWILEDFGPELIREIAGKTGPERERVKHTRPLYAGCAFAVPKRGKESRACGDLLGRLFFSRVGHYWPEGFLVAGIIDEATYCKVRGEVDREVDENTRQAREGRAEIIQVARELGLSPRPTGKDPDFWWANCPAKSHPLEIKASANEFFCGYCGRKGSMEELRMLVRERKGH